jgi:hypothetical protein
VPRQSGPVTRKLRREVEDIFMLEAYRARSMQAWYESEMKMKIVAFLLSRSRVALLLFFQNGGR